VTLKAGDGGASIGARLRARISPLHLNEQIAPAMARGVGDASEDQQEGGRQIHRLGVAFDRHQIPYISTIPNLDQYVIEQGENL
jgi:hypothetical protein